VAVLQTAVSAAEEDSKDLVGELATVMANYANQQKELAAAMTENANQETELEKVHTHKHTHTHTNTHTHTHTVGVPCGESEAGGPTAQ
jgi:adenine-specific DNA glycosylase